MHGIIYIAGQANHLRGAERPSNDRVYGDWLGHSAEQLALKAEG